MRSLEQALELVLLQHKELVGLGRQLKDFQNAPNLNAADKVELIAQLQQLINRKKEKQRETLADLVRFPPHLLGYQSALDNFDAKLAALGLPLARRVFVMTKYPDGKDAALDLQLQLVIDTVCSAVKARGYHPQLATANKLHANLWENIEIQMLGSARGIAIVEDRFNPKLNPNVAMEWGWMRAMNLPVTYLVEDQVEHVPADVAGLIKVRFKWHDPVGSIPPLLGSNELP